VVAQRGVGIWDADGYTYLVERTKKDVRKTGICCVAEESTCTLTRDR